MYDDEDDDEPRAYEDDEGIEIEGDAEMNEDDQDEISAELWQVTFFYSLLIFFSFKILIINKILGSLLGSYFGLF